MDAVRAPEPFKRDNYDNNPCWYHNNISRDEAENLLQNRKYDSFILYYLFFIVKWQWN